MTAASDPWRTTTLVRAQPVTPRMKALHLSVPGLAPHLAGQHVDLRLSAPDGYQALRKYSIASAPGAQGPADAPVITLLVDRLDDGEVSPFLHDEARPGDGFELRGPLGGHFHWSPADGGPLLLVAGGSGIAPLMAMARAWGLAVAAGLPAPPVLLVVSARRWIDIPWHDELQALQALAVRATPGAGLDFVAVTTREPPPRHVFIPCLFEPKENAS